MPKPIVIASPILLTLVFSISSSQAQYHVASLRSLSRVAAGVGEQLDLAISGERTDEVEQLVFSHPAIAAELITTEPLPFATARQPQYGTFRVQIPAEVTPGRYEVRAVGRHGVTNPRTFLISDLPIDIPSQVSSDRATPTLIAKNRLIHAVARPKVVDWYSLEITDGQALQIELLAQRLDSLLIGQIRLFDSAGKQIAGARGSDQIDPLLNTDPLPVGTYLLAIQDFVFRGGNEFQYVLVVGDAGLTDHLFEDHSETAGALPMHRSVNAITIGSIGNLQPDDPQSASLIEQIQPPTELDRWLPPNQADHAFEFIAKSNDPLMIDVVSHRVDEPTDVRMIVQRIESQPTGEPVFHQVAHVDDSSGPTDGVINLSSKDPAHLLVPTPETSYRVIVRDLDIGTTLRPKQKYRLRIRTPDPGFDLVAYRVFPTNDVNLSGPFASKLFRGGMTPIRVFAIRRDGWTGPIHVAIDNLPVGVRCAEAVIATNQNSTQMTLVASEEASGMVESIRVMGRGELETDPQSEAAVFATISRGRGHGRNAIESHITTQLPILVSQADLSPLTLTVGDGNIATVKNGEALSLPIRIVRRAGGNTPCIFRPKDLPAGIAAGEVTIAADATEGALELKPNSDAISGTYSIWLQAETKIKIRPNPQAAERADSYRAHLQTLHDDPASAPQIDAIKAAIVEADKVVEASKAAANEQEITVFIPTNHTTITVVQP